MAPPGRPPTSCGCLRPTNPAARHPAEPCGYLEWRSVVVGLSARPYCRISIRDLTPPGHPPWPPIAPDRGQPLEPERQHPQLDAALLRAWSWPGLWTRLLAGEVCWRLLPELGGAYRPHQVRQFLQELQASIPIRPANGSGRRWPTPSSPGCRCSVCLGRSGGRLAGWVWLGQGFHQRPDLGIGVASVPAQGAEVGQPALLGPATHRLWGHMKELGDLRCSEVPRLGWRWHRTLHSC
jgi:hypothetical protein